jgi:hypothetical protein
MRLCVSLSTDRPTFCASSGSSSAVSTDDVAELDHFLHFGSDGLRARLERLRVRNQGGVRELELP